ncbi:PKD domain-containing protein, partial [Candidatus Bipolaricaulota bacterium]|nr:PKD domain-containing protein [Candidatus Bipolaricaulota bacterium]
MKTRTWQIAAVLLSLVVLANLLGVGQDTGVAPLGIIPAPPQSSGLEARIWVDKGAYALGESITVHYSLNQPAYVYIWDILPDGTTNQILPNAAFGETDNYKTAGEHAITGVVSPPTGTEYLQILASTTPVDPFAYWTGNPETFVQQLQVQILGIVPEAQRSWDFTSFEIISGSSPSYGTLRVNSTPSGAAVWLAGEYVGYTPRTVYVTQGFHQITVSKPGYRSSSVAVFIIGSVTRTINVTLTPLGPVGQDPNAVFTYTPTNPPVNGWVQFDASSSSDPDGSIASHSWSFGDGSTDSGAIAWNQYALPGTYVVTLTVTDNSGRTDTATQAVQVGGLNLPPTAAFSYTPPNPAVNGWVQFNGAASHDPDGSIVSYMWSLGDGSTDSELIAWNQYALSGTYTITLTVTDDDGASGSTSQTIVIGGATNLPPTAAFSYTPPNPAVNGWVQFDGSASTDPDGSIASYSWNFGDGHNGTGPIGWNPFGGAGTYTITLTVIDDDGASDSVSQTIVVGGAVNMPPNAAFSYTPPVPGIGEWVRFDGSSSSDTDGTISPSAYVWSFGDGTPSEVGSVRYHPFPSAGTYLVSLTVTDNSGATNTTTQSLVIGQSQ